MTYATEMNPVYCRDCGIVRMDHINPPKGCPGCGSKDVANLQATVNGGGDVVFYGTVKPKSQEGRKA